eukprot:4527798-Pleurochrysis_carterae.AAC.1
MACLAPRLHARLWWRRRGLAASTWRNRCSTACLRCAAARTPQSTCGYAPRSRRARVRRGRARGSADRSAARARSRAARRRHGTRPPRVSSTT